MKTIDNLKAPKTGVERYEEMDIRWLFSNLVNQSLKAPLALRNCAHAGRRFLGHVFFPVILVPSRTLVS